MEARQQRNGTHVMSPSALASGKARPSAPFWGGALVVDSSALAPRPRRVVAAVPLKQKQTPLTRAKDAACGDVGMVRGGEVYLTRRVALGYRGALAKRGL